MKNVKMKGEAKVISVKVFGKFEFVIGIVKDCSNNTKFFITEKGHHVPFD